MRSWEQLVQLLGTRSSWCSLSEVLKSPRAHALFHLAMAVDNRTYETGDFPGASLSSRLMRRLEVQAEEEALRFRKAIVNLAKIRDECYPAYRRHLDLWLEQ